MPIVFHCGCGKGMQAKEEHAGKKVKCSACGAIVAIPRRTGLPKETPKETPGADAPGLAKTETRVRAGNAASAALPAFAEDESLGQNETSWAPDGQRLREPAERAGMAGWLKLLLILLVLG